MRVIGTSRVFALAARIRRETGRDAVRTVNIGARIAARSRGLRARSSLALQKRWRAAGQL